MGCYIHVCLPPRADSDVWENIGEDVQHIRVFAEMLLSCGVPSRDDDGMFSDNRETSAIEATLGRLTEIEQRYSAELDHGIGAGSSAFEASCYLKRWVALYDTVIQLRARGVAAALFGA